MKFSVEKLNGFFEFRAVHFWRQHGKISKALNRQKIQRKA